MTSANPSAETPKVGGGYKLLGGVAVTVLAVMAMVILFSHRGLYHVYRFSHERVRLEQENHRLAEENARLARTIDRLHHDPEFIQDLIRQELNFVKKNEIIFQFPPEKSGPGPDIPAAGRDEASSSGKVQAIAERKAEKSLRRAPSAPGSGKKAGRDRD